MVEQIITKNSYVVAEKGNPDSMFPQGHVGDRGWWWLHDTNVNSRPKTRDTVR